MTDLTPAQIRATLSAGIISQEQANALLRRAGAAAVGEEGALIGDENEMRFIRGFSDVFIATGMGLLVIGLIAFSAAIGGGGGIPLLLSAAIMFGFAEYFGRIKRQHLPTLVTAIGFLIFINAGVGAAMGSGRFSSDGNILAAIISLIAMIVFYVRIKLPFCMALVAISLVYLLFSIAGTLLGGLDLLVVGILFLISGLAILYVALCYDMRDPERVTRFSDNAFWLHLVSAPLIIHGLVLVSVGRTWNITDLTAVIVLLIVAAVSLFGLAINRRALLVSSLGYAGIGVWYFVRQAEQSYTLAFAITLMILGAAVVFLGAGWNPARRAVLAMLPNLKIFPPVRQGT